MYITVQLYWIAPVNFIRPGELLPAHHLDLTCRDVRHREWTPVIDLVDLQHVRLIPMTDAAETGAINRLQFLAPVFGAGFSYHKRLE